MLLEQELASGEGLLVHDGGSRFNVFSGDAPDAMATFSKVSTSKLGKNASYLAYLQIRIFCRVPLDSFSLTVAEKSSRASGSAGPTSFRAVAESSIRLQTTSTVMLEGGRFVATADIMRRHPVGLLHVSYDEIAHHSNIRSKVAEDSAR